MTSPRGGSLTYRTVLCVWLAAGFIICGCAGSKDSTNEGGNSFQEHVQKDPNDAEAQFNLALTYQSSGDQEKAFEALQITLAINPRHLQAHFHLAVFYFNTRQYSLAIEEYQKILPFNPQASAIHNNLGLAYQLTNQPAKALEHYQKALKLKPDLANGHLNLGFFYDFQKMGKNALRHTLIAEKLYRAGKNAEPNGKMLERARAISQQIQKKYGLNIENISKSLPSPDELTLGAEVVHLKKLISKNPQDILSHMRLAEKLFDLRQYPESLNEFEQVTKIFSQSATAYNNMGNIYLLLNQNEKSVESLKQALAINPEFVAALTNLGRTYQKMGRNREAVDPLEKAVKIIPNDIQNLYDLSAIYFSLGQYGESIQRLEKILQNDANHANAHFALGVAYHKLKVGSKAVEHSKIAENLFTKANNSFMMTQAKMNLDLYNKKYRPLVNGDPK
ncbi:MAG: tetratricopeptide repeat protein [Nitrospinae bacterium]|nr:tetratricopeptide repeat protein [Nitrospinota bacterium]